MTISTSIVYPTSFGYQFDPQPINNPRYILSELNEATSSSDESIRPFVKVLWFGEGFAKKGILYLTGYSTHKIKNEIHRGSISVWCAATMENVAVRNDNANRKNTLDETLQFFLTSLDNEQCNPAFYSAFNKYVRPDVSLESIENAHKELLNLINNPSILKLREVNLPRWWKSLTNHSSRRCGAA